MHSTLPLILLVSEDLMLGLRVEQVVRQLDARLLILHEEADLLPALRQGPRLLLVDAGNAGAGRAVRWIHLVRRWTRDLPLIGFVPHVQVQARAQALAAGCTEVWTRGRFMRELPQLIGQYTAPPPETDGCDAPAPALLREGLILLNAGHYYRCHDLLEQAWMAEERPCRLLYQAILQLAIALYQAGRGNRLGSEKMFARALGKLVMLPDRCQAIDVLALRQQCRSLWEAVARGAPLPPNPLVITLPPDASN